MKLWRTRNKGLTKKKYKVVEAHKGTNSTTGKANTGVTHWRVGFWRNGKVAKS